MLFCVFPVCYDVRLSHFNKDYLLTFLVCFLAICHLMFVLWCYSSESCHFVILWQVWNVLYNVYFSVVFYGPAAFSPTMLTWEFLPPVSQTLEIL